MSADRIVRRHLGGLRATLDGLAGESGRIERWGVDLATRLSRGSRLLAAGNGGSAAEAQHLTAELVGRYRGEREPLSAIALHADTSAITALGNDYGYEEVFARQVRAHGRPGDVLMLLSTSGRSPNLVAAAEAAGRSLGLTVWALTGPGSEPARRRRERGAVPAGGDPVGAGGAPGDRAPAVRDGRPVPRVAEPAAPARAAQELVP